MFTGSLALVREWDWCVDDEDSRAAQIVFEKLWQGESAQMWRLESPM